MILETIKWLAAIGGTYAVMCYFNSKINFVIAKLNYIISVLELDD